MNRQPKIAVIISSTRDARFGARAADWLMGFARQRSDMDFELVDLKTFDLPLFNEKASNLWAPSEDPRAIAWQQKIAEFDGYVVVTTEYNHSITGALKNAFDQAYVEWKHKPIGFFVLRLRWRGRGARHRARAADRRGAAHGAGANGHAHRRRRLLLRRHEGRADGEHRRPHRRQHDRDAGPGGLVGQGHDGRARLRAKGGGLNAAVPRCGRRANTIHGA